ncbi:MAG: peptide deformylase [Bacteroidales bacterium]|jgi:peptide deformylase|nr:peptide deformylase [Bacteroidales bacterium]HOI31318.1 peptide deformylase [Bacteroidales bacterium]
MLIDKLKSVILISTTILICSSCNVREFSAYEKELIYKAQADSSMRITLVTNQEDSLLLRTTSKPINDPSDPTVKLLARRMLATVTDPMHKGVGIAAPQVGINRRLILVQRFDQEDKVFDVIVNPQIIDFSDSLEAVTEGCLSIPNLRGEVLRPWLISIEYQDTTGRLITEKVSGYTARIFQHEIDHLDGILFIDRVDNQ